ncbi:MAG: family 16 glycoside hydrolase [Planctomycetota bacterium]
MRIGIFSRWCLWAVLGFVAFHAATPPLGADEAAAATATVAADSQPVADPAADFVSLFNGRDFAGWRFSDASALPKDPPAAWRIESGSVIGVGDATAILASQWEYGDFELVFEWRASNEDFDADLYVHAGRLLAMEGSALSQHPRQTIRVQ